MRGLSVAAALVIASTAIYARVEPVQDAPRLDPPSKTATLEEQGDEKGLPGGSDENVTVTLRGMGLGPILPDEYVTRLNYRKIDQDAPVRAKEGWKFVWAHLTLDRLDVESSQAMPTIHLVDVTGESYSSDLNWSGIKFLNPEDFTSVSMAEGSGYAAFTIPEGADPAKLTFTYSVIEEVAEDPNKPRKRKRKKKTEEKAHTVDIALATGGDSID